MYLSDHINEEITANLVALTGGLDSGNIENVPFDWMEPSPPSHIPLLQIIVLLIGS